MDSPTPLTGPEAAPAPLSTRDSGEPAAPPPVFWRWIVPALKVLLAAGLLYYVLATKLDEDAKETLKRVFLKSPAFLGLAIAAYSTQILIGSQRLRFLLAAQGVKLSYLTVLRLCYLGAFFDPIGITSVGGDAVKAVYLARATPRGQRVETVSVLVLDRLLGLLGLLTLTLVVALWHIRELSANEEVQPHLKWLFLAAAFLYVGTAMLLSKKVYSCAPLQFAMHKMPLGSIFDRAFFSLQKYRDRPFTLLLGLGMSLLVHLVGIGAGYFLVLGMRGLGEQPALGQFLVAWLISNFICSFFPCQAVGFGQVLYNVIFQHIACVPNGWVLATAAQAACTLAKLPGLAAWLASREHLSPEAGRGES